MNKQRMRVILPEIARVIKVVAEMNLCLFADLFVYLQLLL